MKKRSLANHFLICFFIVVLPVAQGCSALRKPDFSYNANQAYEILESPADPPPKWLQRTTDFGHHVGRATLVSALVVVFAIIRWNDLFGDNDDNEFGFDT